MKKWQRELIGWAAFLLAMILFITLTTGILLPARADYGSTWEAYGQEISDCTDIMFFGSSMVYCDLAPASLWDETGLTAYVMGGSEQTLPLTYYYVRQAMETQSPQMIFVEATGTFYDRYMSYTAINLDYMPRGVNWFSAVCAASEPENRALRFFPIGAYHARWTELPLSDLIPQKAQQDDMAGYTFLSDIGEIGAVSTRTDLTWDDERYANNLEWLTKIDQYCTEHGVKCFFYLAPSYSRLPEQWAKRLSDDLAAKSICFYDLNAKIEEMGLDPRTDFYDYLHVNCRGADRFSRYMGRLALELGAEPSDPDRTSALWQQRFTEFAERMEKSQNA